MIVNLPDSITFNSGGATCTVTKKEVQGLGLENLVSIVYGLSSEAGSQAYQVSTEQLGPVVLSLSRDYNDFVSNLAKLLENYRSPTPPNNLCALSMRVATIDRCTKEVVLAALKVDALKERIIVPYKKAASSGVSMQTLGVASNLFNFVGQVAKVLPEGYKPEASALSLVRYGGLGVDGYLTLDKVSSAFNCTMGEIAHPESYSEAVIGQTKAAGGLVGWVLTGGSMISEALELARPELVRTLGFSSSCVFGALSSVGLYVYQQNITRSAEFFKLLEDKGPQAAYDMLISDYGLSDQLLLDAFKKTGLEGDFKSSVLRQIYDNDQLKEAKNDSSRKKLYDGLHKEIDPKMKARNAALCRRAGPDAAELLEAAQRQNSDKAKLVSALKRGAVKQIRSNRILSLSAFLSVTALILSFFFPEVALLLKVASATIGLFMALYALYVVMEGRSREKQALIDEKALQPVFV